MTPEEAGERAHAMALEKAALVGRSSNSSNHQHIDSILAHAGVSVLHDDDAMTLMHDTTTTVNTGTLTTTTNNVAMSPPLHMSTTYTRRPDGTYNKNDAIYSRHDNPTRLLLERTMYQIDTHPYSQQQEQVDATGSSGTRSGSNSKSETTESIEVGSVEGGRRASYAFSSGLMAASSIVLAHSSPLHVILPKDLYHGVTTAMTTVFNRFNVTTERIDLTTPPPSTTTTNDDDYTPLLKAVKNALQKIEDDGGHGDVIVWIESPSNPLIHVIDIERICTLIRQETNTMKKTASIVVDSTLAPPIITQPLLLGADIVMHSATKFLGGHSDAMCGIVTPSPFTARGREISKKLEDVQIYTGGIASTMDSWLVLRGLRTLRTRVERQCSTAYQLATYLNNHKSVYKVYYPGISNPDSPNQHEVAKKQMRCGTDVSKGPLFGGVLSVEMDSASKAYALAGAVQLINRATSLGGTETLIEHRYSIEPEEIRSSPIGLLRISVGLEDPNDLIMDLQNALQIVDELHTPKE